ncbi:extracellular solute-binding protein [Endozoicomonas sp. SM1973]|uniref:Extracellular solute-binding protein n=1 Tax=Spartinivicinus marinus TaxID=2994442 RepID=A0A853I8B9_9GAMM|nr:extracellular solute-binding protein [Spartinivicinus marinus]MCX4027147.1 extracellular solute-binding protein [Spartinivicinus marinus]NYZ66131.1 extracellular solute-binding protein [Spartinivicinus marinus]
MLKSLKHTCLAATAVISAFTSIYVAAEEKLVVYTARKEHLVKPIFDLYTKQTGVKIDYITDSAGPLITRLQAEGKNTPADLLITVDAGNLWQAQDKGVLQSVKSKTLEQNIPAHLRDPNSHWFGLSVRARTMVYATDRVKLEELSTYANLADKKWDGRLCLRTSKKVYNQSLVATIIERLGKEKTEQVVKGWVNNLAAPVFSNDTMAMEAVAAGQCDVTVVNTYYYGRLLKEKPDTKLKLFWANQKTTGTHVNVSGAGVTKYAKHKAAAVKFLEWLSTPSAQKIFADANMEYPANSAVKPAKLVASWGEFKADQLNVDIAGRKQAEAIKLMDRAGYK